MSGSLAAAGFLAFACAAAACGGAEPEISEETVYSATVHALATREDFIAGRGDAQACVAAAGFPGDPSAEGVKLADGSVFRSSEPQTITAAVLDYLVVREQCSIQSGLIALADAAGVQPTPDVRRARGMNKAKVEQMKCLAELGWEIPEPKMLNGFLIYPAPDGGPEVVSAQRIDSVRCNQRLWGSDYLGGE